MIWVTVGTSHLPFNRLFNSISQSRFAKEMSVQYGGNAINASLFKSSTDFCTREQAIFGMKAAKIVVSHGGVGSILDAISVSRPLILVERKISEGETLSSQRRAIDYFTTHYNAVKCENFDDLDSLIERALVRKNITSLQDELEVPKAAALINTFIKNSE